VISLRRKWNGNHRTDSVLKFPFTKQNKEKSIYIYLWDFGGNFKILNYIKNSSNGAKFFQKSDQAIDFKNSLYLMVANAIKTTWA
jgi:hypothetical protein